MRVTPLEALGARRTITINRLGGVGGLTESVTRLLNASDAQIEALYSTTDPASSFYVGLSEVTGVWCTDWDGQGGDPNRLFNDAYNSPPITDDAHGSFGRDMATRMSGRITRSVVARRACQYSLRNR